MCHNRPHYWCSPSAPLVLSIRTMIWHDKKGYCGSSTMEKKIRCAVTVKTVPNSLLPRTNLSQNTLFLTFIPISLIIYNKRNIQNESSCHSCHKRTVYNLLTYSMFTWSVKSDSKMKLKILSLYRYIFKRANNFLLLKEQHINRIIRRTHLLR